MHPATKPIPLVRPTITEADRAYLREFVARDLEEACEEEIASFEQEAASGLGVAGVAAVSSGTAALHAALAALGVGPGDEVVIPSYTCVALAHAVHLCGATPVLADNQCSLEGYRFSPSTEQIHRCLTRRTKAIVVSHAFGSVAEVAWGGGLDVPVIEDFTLSLGAKTGGRAAGTLGMIGVCSLHAAKMISAGQGGIVASRDLRLLDRVRESASFENRVVGWRRAPASDLHGSYAPAANYQMSGLAAALARSQWRQLSSFIARRIELAAQYTYFFSQAGVECPTVPVDGSNVFYRYLIAVPGRVTELIERSASQGIELGRGVYPPLHVLLGLDAASFPGAAHCVERLISIPLYPALEAGDVARLLAAMKEALSRTAVAA